jgi:hypothetical protein
LADEFQSAIVSRLRHFSQTIGPNRFNRAHERVNVGLEKLREGGGVEFGMYATRRGKPAVEVVATGPKDGSERGTEVHCVFNHRR